MGPYVDVAVFWYSYSDGFEDEVDGLIHMIVLLLEHSRSFF